MQLFPTQRASLFLRADNSRRHSPSTLARVLTFVLTILGRRTRVESAEDAIAARYTGRAWCDSTERELNNDMQ